MTDVEKPAYLTRRIGPADPACGFRCGKHPLDDYFRRHAFDNDQRSIGRAYVVEAPPDDVAAGLPEVIGFYTLSMAAAVSTDVASVVGEKLPRYPMPVAARQAARATASFSGYSGPSSWAWSWCLLRSSPRPFRRRGPDPLLAVS